MSMIKQLKKLFSEKTNPGKILECQRPEFKFDKTLLSYPAGTNPPGLSHKAKMEEKYSRTVLRNARSKEAAIRQMASEGTTFAKIKARLNLGLATLEKYEEILQLKLSRERPSTKRHRFMDDIEKGRKAGLSYAEIGRILGITRERVRQIIEKEDPSLVMRPPRVESLDKPIKRKVFKVLQVDRALFVRVMNLRKQSMTWDQVARQIKPSMSGAILRSRLQSFLPFILTPEERDEFFPKKGTRHYRA